MTTTTHIAGRRGKLRMAGAGAAVLAVLAATGCSASNHDPQSRSTSAPATAAADLAPGDMSNGADNFYTSDRVDRAEGDVQEPVPDEGRRETCSSPRTSTARSKIAAMVVGHPMGAVKEQSANLYATKLAEQGFVTLSLDLSFWGESDGQPRNAVAPDIYTEDFSAAVDYLRTQPFVDARTHRRARHLRQRKLRHQRRQDRPAHQGRGHGQHVRHGRRQPRRPADTRVTVEQRKQTLEQAAAAARRRVRRRRDRIHRRHPVTNSTDQSTPIDREFYDFYRTARGIQPRHHHPADADAATCKFMNFYPFEDIETISPRPMLFITGDQAHSREFSEDAYQLAAEPKRTGHRSRRRPRRPLRPRRPHPVRHVDHLLSRQPGNALMTAAGVYSQYTDKQSFRGNTAQGHREKRCARKEQAS